jgi:hypothetical protein
MFSAALVALFGTTEVQANGKGGKGGGGGPSKGGAARVVHASHTKHVATHVKHATAHRFVHLHRGYHIHYRGWTRYCWFPTYRCYGYFCPTALCWYYWYAPQQCYLPISYVTTYPPTPTTGVTVNVTGTSGGVPTTALPPGATPLPSGTVPPLPGGGS